MCQDWQKKTGEIYIVFKFYKGDKLMSKVSIVGSEVSYSEFWNKMDRSMGRTMVKINDVPIKKHFKNYVLKKDDYYGKWIKISLHRFFTPCFSVSIVTEPIIPNIKQNIENGGRNIINIPYSNFCSKIL
jgi:hypothetical protein